MAKIKQSLWHIWQDLRERRNLEMYFFLVVTFAMFVASLLGVSNQQWFFTLVLSSLLLLMWQMTEYRRFIERTDRNFEIVHDVLRKELQKPIRIYNHWRVKEVCDLIASAKESIVIIDSWFGESPALAGCIKNSAQPLPLLKIDVYMLDPEKPFGAQRHAEWAGQVRATERSPDDFRAKFNDSIQTFRAHFSGMPTVSYSFYKYPTLPEIRMYIIDNKHFIFSWFPVYSPSAENICFHVTEQDDLTSEVVKALRKHYEYLHSISSLVYSNEDQMR